MLKGRIQTSAILIFIFIVGFISATVISLLVLRDKRRQTNGAVTDENIYKNLTTNNNNTVSYNNSVPSVAEQVKSFFPNVSHYPLHTLYIFWTGSNDYVNIFDYITHTEIINSLLNSISLLSSSGARKFLILNLPPLHRAPYYNNDESLFDTWGFLERIINDPQAYGLKDVVNTCLNVNYVREKEEEKVKRGRNSLDLRNKIVEYNKNGNIETYHYNDNHDNHNNAAIKRHNRNTKCDNNNNNNKINNNNNYNDDETIFNYLNSSSQMVYENPDEYLWWDEGHPIKKVHKLLALEVESFLRSSKGNCLYLIN
ncbi:hypothetical protein Glove_10g12 [Diversispora epigaea]|uniref:Carbohydrate esterase family 16 protein n=1 Tax=Diversispora epigaea TaxID=1348612 RepID=A0A397JN62_9GLOM|nr:hypothetical protein Glove_10g12 [Diversispora epigaea]